jgi:hypothetical protein
VKWLTNLFRPLKLPPELDRSAPRCETAEEPYLAGYEDRLNGGYASVHPSIYMHQCQCIRCREYMHGWRDADEDRINRLRRLHAQSRSNVRGHAPIHREPEPTPAPPESKFWVCACCKEIQR